MGNKCILLLLETGATRGQESSLIHLCISNAKYLNVCEMKKERKDCSHLLESLKFYSNHGFLLFEDFLHLLN